MAGEAPFPDNPEEFLDDPRISLGKTTNRYVLESDNGEWEWIANRWVPTMDEALLAQQAQIYRVAGVDEDAPAVAPGTKKRKREAAPAAKAPRENTAIYVTGLPAQVSEGALADFFGKCGLIAESVDTNKPRIKMYTDESGAFKGEALIVFFRPESVKLAVDLYDDSPFPTTRGPPSGNMRIHAADEGYKRHKDDVPPPAPAESGQKPARPAGNRGDREKAKKKREEMNDRLNDWGEGDPSAVYGDRDRWEDRLVIIENVFTQASIKQAIVDGEDEYLDDIHADMLEEAEKLGKVNEVVVYDLEDPGVVTIDFKSAEDASDCIKMFHGRNYDGRKLRAYTSDGSKVFHKTQPGKEGALNGAKAVAATSEAQAAAKS